MDSGPDCLEGASFLSLRALRTPKRVVGWDSFSDHRAAASRSSRHTSLAGLCLWVFTSNLCPYTSKINISKITFSTCLSLFKETVKDCHYPNSFTWTGLAFKAFHLLLYSLPLAHSPPALPADVLSDLPNRSLYLGYLSLSPVPFQIPPPLNASLIFSINPKPYGSGASVCLSIQPTKPSPSLTRWVRAIGCLILLLGC